MTSTTLTPSLEAPSPFTISVSPSVKTIGSVQMSQRDIVQSLYSSKDTGRTCCYFRGLLKRMGNLEEKKTIENKTKRGEK